MSVLTHTSLRKIWILLAIVWLVAPLVTISAADSPAWSVNLVDASGTTVHLTKPPQSIISLTLSSDEILFSLVERSRLKGITFLSTDPGISNIAAAARGFPTRLSGEKEQIIALQPDLVLVADWKEAGFAQALRQAGIKVFVFRSPENFGGLWDYIRLLATLTNRVAQGEAMIKAHQERLRQVWTRVGGLAEKSRRTVLSYSLFGSSYGGDTSFNAIAVAAGVRNCTANYKGWPKLSKESLLTIDPDIILLPSWSYQGTVNGGEFKARFLADPVFAQLKAVRAGRVLNLPDPHFMANSQYMVDAVEDLAKAAYPELF